ncbi:MAG: transglycosylase domain-containing protein, partial [Acidimicrobiales bacterium]
MRVLAHIVGIPLRFVLLVAVGGAGLALLALGLTPAATSFAGMVSLDGHAPPVQLDSLKVPSYVYAANGQLLSVLQDSDFRKPVKLSQVPAVTVHAVLDVEDKNFYKHGAIDASSIFRAAKADLTSGRIVQGGSTITQQLIKKDVLSSKQTIGRKLHEALLAFRLQKQMDKSQILERYLNTVYFGNGAYGIAAAAYAYFNEDVGQLDAAQSALLAGMIENPSYYNPITEPANARARRNLALDQMVANHHLTAAQAAAAKQAPLPTSVHRPGPSRETTFVEEVVHQLLSDPRLGSTFETRYDTLFEGGLRIYTSLDPAMQADAQAAVAKELPNTGGRFTAALVAVDPANGEVRALVPGNNSTVAGFDVVTGLGGGAGRQPGSSFKLFSLMALIHQGYSVNDTVDGTAPCYFANPGGTPDPYPVQNAEPGYGIMTVAKATYDSVNCAYMRLGIDAGLSKVLAMAKRMGNIDAPANLSAIIGGDEVHPIDMAAAYATMADGGIYHRPVFVTKVVDQKGKVLISPPGKGRRVLPAAEVEVGTSVLQQVVQHGTGTAAALPGRPAAGKTGTTDHFYNAWFDGYTPQLATVVWMGDPSGDVTMQYPSTPITVYGGTYPAQIWHDFMTAALAGKPVVPFTAPPSYVSGVGPGHYLPPPSI